MNMNNKNMLINKNKYFICNDDENTNDMFIEDLLSETLSQLNEICNDDKNTIRIEDEIVTTELHLVDTIINKYELNNDLLNKLTIEANNIIYFDNFNDIDIRSDIKNNTDLISSKDS